MIKPDGVKSEVIKNRVLSLSYNQYKKMELKKVLLVDDDEGFNFLNRIVFTDNKVICQVDEVDGWKRSPLITCSKRMNALM